MRSFNQNFKERIILNDENMYLSLDLDTTIEKA